jgi:hypothetical protein
LIEAASRENAVDDALILIARAGILWEVADSAGLEDLTTSGQGLACEDLRERALAGAVTTNESNAVTGVNADGDIFY